MKSKKTQSSNKSKFNEPQHLPIPPFILLFDIIYNISNYYLDVFNPSVVFVD